MANSLNQNQIYTVLNAINAQAKTGGSLTAVDTSSFVTVAQTVLESGYDNLMSAVSQVLSRTIFAHRPYDALLDILYLDEIRWGNHVRKISPLDDDAEADQRLPLTDGESVDPWKINKPKMLQTNFYGQEMYQRHKSIPKDQIDTAFGSEDELARFVAMIYAHARDLIRQDEEDIGGIYYTSPASVVNLLTEYNTETGLSLTKADVYKPANYTPFIQWASARIMTISDMLRQRSYMWHKNLTGINIPRHTPREYQRMIISAPEYRKIENSALANVWHEQYVQGFGGFESVNFFQNPSHPQSVNVTPSIINDAGEFVKADQIVVNDIFAMIFDRDAIGQTRVNQWSQATPMNPAGGYSNIYWHYTNRWYNDFTENAVLFTLS